MQDSGNQISNTALSTEREQAIIRLISCSIITLYTSICYFNDLLSKAVFVMYLFAVPFSLLIIFWVVAIPGKNHFRRMVAMSADLGTTTVAMSLSGAAANPLFLFYLWITFGNGFRYGKNYLYISMCLSIIGFSIVMYSSPFWSEQLFLGVGLLITLTVLPLYVASLLKRLQAAIEQALQEENAGRLDGPELTVDVERVGTRPAARGDSTSPVVQRAMAATLAFGVQPSLRISSTDANLPISKGIPAVTMSRGGVSGNSHSPDEWWQNVDGHVGMQIGLVTLLAEAGLAK